MMHDSEAFGPGQGATGEGGGVDQIGAVAVLADPVRRRLYEAVAEATTPIGREEAARLAAVPVHSARFHLDKLVDAGLLEVSFARLTGRSGPGAGRPAKLYRRGAGEVAVSLPRRGYDLVGGVLAAALERALGGADITGALRDEARSRGRASGTSYDGSGSADELDRATAVLASEGFEPQRLADEVCLRNCPFDSLARQHTELVCGVNLDFVAGVLEGLGCASAQARLQPDAEHCCVRVHAD
jgi:predicted ArsR family transcriptional regulator